MNCCENCFQDLILLKKIKSFEEWGDCSYCESKDVLVLAIEELADLFDQLYSLYSVTKAYEHFNPEIHKEPPYGDSLIDLINEDWNIFSPEIEGSGKDNELLFDILESNKSIYDFDDNYPEKNESYSRIRDSIYYESTLSYLKNDWSEFSKEIKKQNRFLNRNGNRLFEGIEEILKKKEKFFSSSKSFFRGRIGRVGKYDLYSPPFEKASAGRANPKGISYLYCATNEDTCCAELRPWKSATITIGKFHPTEELILVDISDGKINSPFDLNPQDDPNLINNLLLFLSNKLSEPISPNNAEIDYLPTQYLVELIKSFKYDGIIFKSNLGTGNNIVLFDDRKVLIDNISEFRVKDIDYTIEKDFDL